MAVLTCFPVAGRSGDNEAALGGQGPVAVVAGPGAPDRPDRRGRGGRRGRRTAGADPHPGRPRPAAGDGLRRRRAGRRAATAPGTDGTPRPEGPPPAGRPAAGPPQPETASCPRQPPAATGNSRQSRTCPVVPPPPRPVATSS